MPTLDWIGKKAVVNHHRDVPYRLIHCDKDKSVGDPDAGNLLVQGDNLEALKALLPYYAGKVKCIYIDPPYNTGNEGWVYNDNVNSPEIKAWLGSVVGKEAEDLSRHDKWLCMMYPRLRLLKEFLSEDGSIWISIDDNEAHTLKILCDEIFGRTNFIANIVWQKRTSPEARVSLGDAHEDILVYANGSGNISFNKLELNEENFSNPDNDPRGNWASTDFTAQGFRPNQMYEIQLPNGIRIKPPEGRCWANIESVFLKLRNDNRIWFGKSNDARPRVKKFFSELEGKSSWTWWPNNEVGHSQEGKKESISLFGIDAFATPKPEKLLGRVIKIATNSGDLVLDSFAGSGTTGAVAHKMGRKHISVEMGEHAHTHIVPRYRKVIEGEQGGISADFGWQGGGGFRFCALGEPLFDADGNVSPAVTYPDLAAHVFFCETGSPLPRRADGSTPLIGTFQGRAIYLLGNSSLVPSSALSGHLLPQGEKEESSPPSLLPQGEKGGAVLNGTLLDALPLPEPGFSGARIIYGEGCTVPEDRLSRLGITFKQIPYQIEGL